MSTSLSVLGADGRIIYGPFDVPRLKSVSSLKDRLREDVKLLSGKRRIRLLFNESELLDSDTFSGKEFDNPVVLTVDADESFEVVSWGNPDFGGDSTQVVEQLKEPVVSIYSNDSAFAAITQSGAVVTWGSFEAGGDSSSVAARLRSGVVSVRANNSAFAALKSDGSVVSWGDADYGGDTSAVDDQLQSDVMAIHSNQYAFAALRKNGSVVTWGSAPHGGDPGKSADLLKGGIRAIYSSYLAFVVLTHRGAVVAWGDADYGGDTSGVAEQLSDSVIGIYSNEYAFAALKEGGPVVTWGNAAGGGTCPPNVAEQISSGVVAVYRSSSAFVALKAGGAAVAWGDVGGGGDCSSVAEQLQSNVKLVCSTSGAFAALKCGGEVVVWGAAEVGGDCSSVRKLLMSGIGDLHSNAGAFMAITLRGGAVTWGDEECGGDSRAVEKQLKRGITRVCKTRGAFAVLKKGGEVVAWGSEDSGGDLAGVAAQLETGVVAVYSNNYAFAARKDTGQLVTWGNRFYGGDSSVVADSLERGVRSVHCTEGAFVAFLGHASAPEAIEPVSTVKQQSSVDPTLYGSTTSSAPSGGPLVGLAGLMAPAAPFVDCELVKILGSGSFGTVWYGNWGGCPVAVKVMKHESDTTAEKGEQFEALLAERLSHPNIVQTFKCSTRNVDVEQEDRCHQRFETWIVMEYCNLGTLSQHCDKNSTLLVTGEVNVPQVLGILREIGSAVGYLQTRGIIHGDLSANNVMLVERGHGFTCKVCDFGLARVFNGSAIATKSMGTITHMPPELLRNNIMSEKVDVYSWGVLMFQVWTCQMPWFGLRPQQIIVQVASGKRLQLPAGTPSGYAALFDAATSPAPEARPSLQDAVKGIIALEDMDSQA